MLKHAERYGAKIRFNTTVVGLSGKSANGPVGIRLLNGQEVLVKTVLLNLPQHPVIELLRRSDPAIAQIFPRPLYAPIKEDIMKLYVHYDNAWWRNDLGLTSGAFHNSEKPLPNPGSPASGLPNQVPTPLQGQYHDGDVRCDNTGKHCSGFLQAYYGGDTSHEQGGINHAIGYYSVFHDSITDDSVVHITSE